MHQIKTDTLRCLLSLFLVSLVACSTGPFLRPEASTAHYVRVNPACPGPARVVQFTPESIDWVHIRVWAELPVPARPTTKLYIEVQTEVGLGLPREKWGGPESTQRSEHKFRFAAAADGVQVTFMNGEQIFKPVKLFKGVSKLSSETIALAAEKIILSKKALKQFTLHVPTVFIDGEAIEIPPIIFRVDEERYFPVLNC